MPKHVVLTETRTYASIANVEKAVERALGGVTGPDGSQLRYLVMRTEEGRYYPVFLGEQALQAGVHFHFYVVM